MAKRLRDDHSREFIECYKQGESDNWQGTWSKANPNGQWRFYIRKETLKRNKTSLDNFWLSDLDNLPSPDEIA